MLPSIAHLSYNSCSGVKMTFITGPLSRANHSFKRLNPHVSRSIHGSNKSCSDTATISTVGTTNSDDNKDRKRVALVMGVANQRSIAWSCVEAFHRQNYHVLSTYENERMRPTIDKLIMQQKKQHQHQHQQTNNANSPIIEAIHCSNIETDLPILFEEQIPSIMFQLQKQQQDRIDSLQQAPVKLDSVVHSVAYAPFDSNNDNDLSQASLKDFSKAHHISAYSLLETARYAKTCMNASLDADNNNNASITALTYLGAVRAVPQYSLMGPAKASLEACVRGLAVELGNFSHNNTSDNTDSNDNIGNGNNRNCIRVNAVSAGPLRTLSSRGIPQFMDLWQHVQDNAPLGRNVTQQEVANTVEFLASDKATGITGQVMYVDAGYSSVVPV